MSNKAFFLSVKRRLSQKYADYWDYVTLLELNILSDEQKKAYDSLSSALTEIRERWEPESTAESIELIIEAKKNVTNK